MLDDVPKGGTTGQRHATDEEWKEALRLRLDEIGWSQVELARRLGVTPGAITHLFKKAVTSTLRPRIEQLVGWPDADAPRTPTRLAAGTEPGSDEISRQLAELIGLFQALSTANRLRLVERAHALWEAQGDARKGSRG